MPFIDTKLSVKTDEAKKENIKKRLGEAVSILHKTESFLMVGFDDEYDLYFAGNKVEKGAYVAISLYGKASSDAYSKMSAEVCRILEEELGIPGDRVYVTYREVSDWGWNGTNF